ncbi:hypothetical protein GCM10009863_54350 [Streptomyces axinellae]|uniref:Uncharacterized protein n=1 Tax=Streptomyces axinellae TaxID=552788 RepID=A0ABN3QP88_9ACTN
MRCGGRGWAGGWGEEEVCTDSLGAEGKLKRFRKGTSPPAAADWASCGCCGPLSYDDGPPGGVATFPPPAHGHTGRCVWFGAVPALSTLVLGTASPHFMVPGRDVHCRPAVES